MLHKGLVWKISTGEASPLRGAGPWRSYSYMFIHVNKCCNLFSTNKPFEWLPFWVNTIVFLYFFYFAVFHCIKYLVIPYIFFSLQFSYLSCILYDSQRGGHVLLFFHFPCKPYDEYRHFDSFVFVICLFVSVVPIFPHKSQREGLFVHVNFCVNSDEF